MVLPFDRVSLVPGTPDERSTATLLLRICLETGCREPHCYDTGWDCSRTDLNNSDDSRVCLIHHLGDLAVEVAHDRFQGSPPRLQSPTVRVSGQAEPDTKLVDGYFVRKPTSSKIAHRIRDRRGADSLPSGQLSRTDECKATLQLDNRRLSCLTRTTLSSGWHTPRYIVVHSFRYGKRSGSVASRRRNAYSPTLRASDLIK
jgi:hypothetical protein